MKTYRTVILYILASLAAWGCDLAIGTGRGMGDPAVYPVPSSSSAKRVLDIGPGYRYEEISELPWLELTAGDLVRIHYRATPYQGIIGLRARATEKSPVRIYGVPGPNGELPTITGAGATAGANLAGFFNESTTGLGVIVIYGPWDEKPSFIEIANLKITGACEGSTYADQTGTHPWTDGSCGIWLKAGNVSVKGCEIYGNNEGILAQANYDSIENISSDFLLEGCRVYGNGMVGSDRFHNLYIQGAGMTVQFCYIGTLRRGAGGSSLKDRSSGTVIRYNLIEAGARLLDLVEPEDTYALLSARPDFRETYVYGNILINESSSVNGGCGTLFHYGADNVPEQARNGSLYFYSNTVYSRASQDVQWSCRLFEAESPDALILCSDNVFDLAGGSDYYLLDELGRLRAEGGNWITSGWSVHEEGVGPYGTLEQAASLVQGIDPLLADPAGRDFALAARSPARGIAVGPPAVAAASHPVEYQYRDGRVFAPRESAFDAGAIER